MGAYFDGMLRYFEFSGRSTRTQYWMFYLVQFVLITAVLIISIYLRGGAPQHWTQMPVLVFMLLIHIVPNVTVQVRRLHDIGRSGAWVLLQFIPLGGVVLLYWACKASQYGGNAHDEPAASPAKTTRSSIPRGIRMGTTLVSGRIGQEPAAGRFI